MYVMLEKEAEYDRHTGFLNRLETICSVSVAVSNSQASSWSAATRLYVYGYPYTSIHTYTDLGFEFHIRSIQTVL